MADRTNGRLVSQVELAQLCGVKTTTIRVWERKGCPIHSKGSAGKASAYNTADVMRWREEQAALAATGDTNAMDMEEARRRKTAAEAALAEMELAIKRGEYVLVDEVGAVVESEYATIRANFSSMPGDIAGDLEHLQASEIEELLATKVSEILNELSADSEFASEDPAQEGESGGTEAAAEAKRR
ncbi:terminase small subunit [Tianweitania sediminis]|uniref:Terminase small subunit n=1 Tax=Tianweitania sediminis TaxID=1502156 RepID=A0A8J7RP94_9HYPH|nr:terminase small subunit [Tianweitania sediminis]MBP0440676.1 terminase small subunit [Tianweitania sediminis]